MTWDERLARILLHEHGGDAAFLVNGHKMPFIAPEFTVKPIGHGVIGVTVTFLADDVLVLGAGAAKDEARRIVDDIFKEGLA